MKVSIITVNYNQTQVTLDLLHSLRSQSFQDLEVIVIDNGSVENPAEVLLKSFPEIKFIRSEKNLGFAGGNNLGIKEAQGEYVFFVNNDTEIPDFTIHHLVDYLETNKKCGVISPFIYYYDQKEMLQYGGYSEINVFTGRNSTIGNGTYWKLEDKVSRTDFPHGAAMMVPRTVIDEVGNMPEEFFLYYEEMDWAATIKDKGYEINVDHGSYILHKESVSTGKLSELKTYFLTRNRILYMRRNGSLAGRIAFTAFFGLLSIPKNLLSYALHAEWKHARAFVAGVSWNFKNTTSSSVIGYKFNYLRK